MSGATTFSNNYYTSATLFWKNATSEPLSDGGYRLKFNSCWNFWDRRTIHACIDNQGTISTAPFSLFGNLKRYFGLSQNQDLIAVNQKLIALQAQIQQNPNSPEAQALISEIHDKKERGADAFTWSLVNLNGCFAAGNRASDRVATLLKVVNFFRGLFNLQPIAHYHYQPINTQFFQYNVIPPAMQLTPQDRLTTKFFPLIQLNGPLTLPANLTHENLQKLELGLKNRIAFVLDDKNFVITYNKRNEQFVFSYTNAGNVPSYSRVQDINYRSEPFNVVEKKWDGSVSTHPLQFSIEHKTTGRWWLGTEKTVLRYTSGNLPMLADREYTIPLPQGGNLRITMLRRTLPQ